MSQVRAVAAAHIHAPVKQVSDALADYATVRPEILPAQYTDYALRSGGTGAGTEVAWKLHATEKRIRDCAITVTSPEEGVLVETDANSSMVTTYTVVGSDDGHASVVIETVWNGAGGIGGFFERTFAPKALVKIYDEMLANLAARVQSED
ncbi:MAG TPA: SRPBCC family protein [Actinospica sp.]|nr:SRPBCC family protein [Actinospica sp.]